MKKLAIVGSGPETREQAPFNDESWDIWIFNEAATSPWCKRWNAVFQMHKAELYKAHNTKDPKHWEWLQQSHGKPIYMQAVDPQVPDSVRYPLEDAIALSGEKYLSATVAMVCALAVLQGYEHVGFWGVELSVTEYRYQAECLRYWVGFLKGRLGAEHVELHSFGHRGQSLFTAPLYGYDGGFALGAEFFQGRVSELDASWKERERELQRLRDKLEKQVREMKFEKVPDLIRDYQKQAMAVGEIAGALSEAERYASFGDRIADRNGFETEGAIGFRDGELKKWETAEISGIVNYVWNLWRQTGKNEITIQLLQWLAKLGSLSYDMGALFGKHKENIAYIQEYDAMLLANGVSNA